MTQKTRDRLMCGAAILVFFSGAVVLDGCAQQITGAQSAIQKQIVDPLLTDLSKIGNTTGADLKNVVAVANAATPPDADGANCATAALTVQQQIAKVLTAANTPAAGVLTTAEVASLFQPGSAQYNQARQTLTSGCAAKAQDVLGAAGLLAAGGVLGAISAGQVLPVLAAAG